MITHLYFTLDWEQFVNAPIAKLLTSSICDHNPTTSDVVAPRFTPRVKDSDTYYPKAGFDRSVRYI